MIFGSLVATQYAFAQASDSTGGDPITSSELLPPAFGDEVGLGQGDLNTTVARVIRIVLGFLGVVALGIMLWGGVRWMTAGGNMDNVKDAQKIIAAGAVGLAIILSAFAITSFVINSLVTATTT
ncbi:hypothetical protein A3C17_04005 [Candidatus Uhrbacteria bacterium RIFCSPHIGHO2_02_FULL_53_13]|nr:MAG: hypothetical protein A3C17_04005 [Candidatus Uhrbacteria bacterium RIFCSPHIGHO2_02_FULL_53_13]